MKMFVKRMYAGLLDLMTVSIFLYLAYYMYYYYAMKSGSFTVNLDAFGVEYKVVSLVGIFIFYILSELLGFSVGKKVFKIKLDYGKYTKTARFLRPLFKILTLNCLPLLVISVFTKDHLLFYDYILKTDITEAKYERSDLR